MTISLGIFSVVAMVLGCGQVTSRSSPTTVVWLPELLSSRRLEDEGDKSIQCCFTFVSYCRIVWSEWAATSTQCSTKAVRLAVPLLVK